MVVMGEEPRLNPSCLFGLLCQLFGYSHNTVALPPKHVFRVILRSHAHACMYQLRSSRLQYITPETGPAA
jgi:hypothetical protein